MRTRHPLRRGKRFGAFLLLALLALAGQFAWIGGGTAETVADRHAVLALTAVHCSGAASTTSDGKGLPHRKHVVQPVFFPEPAPSNALLGPLAVTVQLPLPILGPVPVAGAPPPGRAPPTHRRQVAVPKGPPIPA